MLNSLFLSLFFIVFLILEIISFRWFDLKFLEKGKELHIPKITYTIILLIIFLIFAFFSLLVINKSEPEVLQIFYIILFIFSFLVTSFFLLQLKNLRFRILISLILTLTTFLIVNFYPYQLTQNIFIAVSLLWVGSALFKKFKFPLKYFIIFLILFTLIDIYNIYFYKNLSLFFSDENFFLNGLVVFGDYSLGIGDFFLGYLIVNAALVYFRKTSAWVLAFLLPLPRFLIRIILPETSGLVFPYSIFMVPIALFIYYLDWRLSKYKTNH